MFDHHKIAMFDAFQGNFDSIRFQEGYFVRGRAIANALPGLAEFIKLDSWSPFEGTLFDMIEPEQIAQFWSDDLVRGYAWQYERGMSWSQPAATFPEMLDDMIARLA